MQRSYLLSIDFKVTSITEWAAQLKMNPLYAILSGFEVGDTPGVGTFYDFFSKLWDSDSNNLNPHLYKLKTPVKNPKKKGYKAQPVENVTVDQLLSSLENQTFSLSDQPYGSLFDIYSKEFLVTVHRQTVYGFPCCLYYRKRRQKSQGAVRMVQHRKVN